MPGGLPGYYYLAKAHSELMPNASLCRAPAARNRAWRGRVRAPDHGGREREGRGVSLAHSPASKGPELILAHRSKIAKPCSEVKLGPQLSFRDRPINFVYKIVQNIILHCI